MALILALCSFGAIAQNYPNNLSEDSVDPEGDAAFLQQMRSHLDSIRRCCHRPTVALVLSGGGAKGAAEVGALRLIEEKGIPIDLVCGTSIGGLVGGLYAIGYSSEDIHRMFVSQDWGKTLTDRIPQSYYPYDVSLHKSRYSLSIPFKYEEEEMMERLREQYKYATGGHKLDTQRGLSSLTASLPSGYAFGFNVNNLFSALTVGYQDSLDFARLPVPFVCVASDLVSCKAKNWSSGVLKTAMRSTMSIPGLYSPVREQGMVLVDGGTRNNFPTDLARAAGADYIIGIDLSDARPTYAEINNIGNIVSQFITMLGKDSFDSNVDGSDVLVKPFLDGYNMLSFKKEAVDTMVSRGYRAALEKEDQLDEIKAAMPEAVPVMAGPRATDIRSRKVQIMSVEFEGVTDRESRMLQNLVKVMAGSRVDAADMEDAMCTVQATGAFEYVTYSLLGREEPYRLVFNCVKGPVHQLGLSLRMDTEEWFSLAGLVGFNAHKLMGPKVDFSFKLGLSQKADARLRVCIPRVPTLNASVGISNYNFKMLQSTSGLDMRFNKKLLNNVNYWSHKEMIYLSSPGWKKGDFSIGVKNQYYELSTRTYYGYLYASTYGSSLLSGNYLGAFARGEFTSMDDAYYPSSGLSFSLGYNLDFVKSSTPDFLPVHMFAADFKMVFPLGRRLALIPDAHVRVTGTSNSLFKNFTTVNDSYSIAHSNYVGGMIGGRYIEQQVPYVGFNELVAAEDVLAVVNLDLRCRVGRNVYVSVLAGAINDGPTVSDFFTSSGRLDYAFALAAGLDTIVGPMRGNVSWDALYGWSAVLSLGLDF